MNSISIILSSILCAASPLIAQDAPTATTEQTAPAPFELGTQAIEKLRTAYANGEYDPFLKEMNDSYQSVSADSLASFADTRSATRSSADVQKWEELAYKLQIEKNEQLLKAIPSDDQSLFAEKVRNVAGETTTPEQLKAIAQLAQYRQLAPMMGKNSDENRLIDIDLEYEYKAVHLDMPGSESTTDRREKQYILRMDKMSQMVEAAKSFEDESLKQVVQLASENLDSRLSQSWDGTDLTALAKGKIKAENASQKKVAAVVSSYQSQFNELSQQFLETR